MKTFVRCRLPAITLALGLLSLAASGLYAADAAGSDAKTSAAGPSTLWVYVGTYTYGDSKGIYLCRLDMASGKLELASATGGAVNPSFLALHPKRPLLYSVCETSNFEGSGTGAVCAFAIEPKTGQLKALNRKPSYGTGPCHLTVDQTGRHLLVANYGSGGLAAMPIAADGLLGSASCVMQHVGSSVNRQRQKSPHAHGVYLDAANRFALVPDLGIDKVLVYRFSDENGKLRLNRPAWTATAAGAGPRHLAFHPEGRFVYAINELNSTVAAYGYDAACGTLREIECVSTLPKGFEGSNTTAEVAVHPSGKFVYGSNRGHNSIAIFAVDEKNGKLRVVGHEPTQGKTPRNFAIDPTGRYLLAANQDTNNVVVFRIEGATGRLESLKQSIEIPAPVCLVMRPPVEE